MAAICINFTGVADCGIMQDKVMRIDSAGKVVYLSRIFM